MSSIFKLTKPVLIKKNQSHLTDTHNTFVTLYATLSLRLTFFLQFLILYKEMETVHLPYLKAFQNESWKCLQLLFENTIRQIIT